MILKLWRRYESWYEEYEPIILFVFAMVVIGVASTLIMLEAVGVLG